jgi:hypothetical protein
LHDAAGVLDIGAATGPQGPVGVVVDDQIAVGSLLKKGIGSIENILSPPFNPEL